MKKLFLFTLASMMTIVMMAEDKPSGLSKADAIEFSWDEGIEHRGDTTSLALWYRVDLAPLTTEENPSLTLYLTNPSRDESVDVSMTAYVMGNKEAKSYTITPHQHKTYTENASLLIRMQDEVFLTLKSSGRIKLSAKVFEAADLDETCKDAKTLRWCKESTQTAGYAAWWKIDLLPIKDANRKDALITITNKGNKELTLKAGQSLDCPSSGLTKRSYTLAAGETMYDTIPQSMVQNVQPTELYFSIENDQPIAIRVDSIPQPVVPVIKKNDPYVELQVEKDTVQLMPASQLYRFSVKDMRDTAKYEPEFTYRNIGTTPAKVIVKMAFDVPAYGTSNTEYEIAPGESEIVVYKKNMLDGLDPDSVPYIYLLTSVEGEVQFTSRFKHVREGKACLTNIDFKWQDVYTQEARTTVWYQIETDSVREENKDIIIHLLNQGKESANLKALLSFECPTKDAVQEISRTISANGNELTHRIGLETYAMMKGTIWLGLETSQDIKFWLTTEDVELHEPDYSCEKATKDFKWEGVEIAANDTVWYKVGMDTLKNMKEYPMFYIYNRGDQEVKIEAMKVIDCPNELPTETRTLTIPANGSYKIDNITKNTFNGIFVDTIYVRIVATQPIAVEMVTTVKPAGSACDAALPFNWEIGNDQKAGEDLWYEVSLRQALISKKDVRVSVTNKENKDCALSGWMSYDCSGEENPITRSITLKAKETRFIEKENSWFQSKAKDSVLYIRVKGSTGLHLFAELIDPKPFDPIEEEELQLIPIQWNKTYTQEVDTAWYYISKDELNVLTTTSYVPEATITNQADGSNKVRVDYAFHLPITQAMMNKSWTLKANQSVNERVQPVDMKEYLKKDSVLVRIIAQGKIEFSTTLVNPYNGSDCSEAIRVGFGDEIEQPAYTIRWYRINIAKLKQTPNLYGKSVTISTKNHGGAATIQVGIFDGCEGSDLFEGYEKFAKRTVSAGSGTTRSIPAYVVYGLANNDIYVRVETNQRLTFSTKLSDYAPAEADPNQQKAKLVVPKVDYYIPADTTVWYRVCFPYLLKNYALTEKSSATFRNLGDKAAKITGTATFQDTLTYKIPERTRTVSAGKDTTLTWREMIEYAVKKAAKRKNRTVNLDLTDTKLSFVDSIIRHYIDSVDHNAAQIRIRTTQPLYFRVDNVRQTTGDAANNPMVFDWKHGNVNPKDQQTWYLVDLHEGMERLPEGKDLRLHVTNWSDQPAKATAVVQMDLGTPKEQQRTINYTLQGNEDTWRNIDRKLLMGDANPLIQFTSESDVHIWAEVVPARDRDSVVVKDTFWICNGEERMIKPLSKITREVVFEEGQTGITYKDSIAFINDTAAAEWDSICYRTFYLRKNPVLYKCDQISEDSIPVIKKGEVINCEEATAWLMKNLRDGKDTTVKYIDTIIWEWSTNDANTDFEPIPTTPVSYEGIVLRYRVVTGCENDTLTIPDEDDGIWYYYNTAHADTVRISSCTKTYKWAVNKKEYTKPEDKDWLIDSATKQSAHGCDSIIPLRLTFLDPVEGEETITSCKAIKWHGIECNEEKDYICDTLHTPEGCDSIATLHFKLRGTIEGETTKVSKLCSYTWKIMENGQEKTIGTYSEPKIYDYTTKTAEGCDSIIYLDLTILEVEEKTIPETACNSYTWKITVDGEEKTIGTYYESKKYEYTVRTKDDQCDSIKYILDLDLKNPTVRNLPAVSKLGNHLIMIDRKTIADRYGWALDSVGAYVKPAEVVWYRADDEEETNKEQVGIGYYIIDNKAPLVGVYWAEITLPTEGDCEYQYGYTNKIICQAPTHAAPALRPSLARPGEDVSIINLDPEQQTYIRVYTTEGLLQGAYMTQGKESFSIKAATEHGFYLVELSGENIKSTLRYIVK